MERPTLTVYCGLPGVGKSAASAYTAANTSAERYRSDEIRKELFPDPRYTTEETLATYEELLERARTDLETGSSVVLDATFRTRGLRDRADELAREAGAHSLFVQVSCEETVVKQRLAAREGDVSDADVEVYEHVRDSFESLERDHVVVDNSDSLEETYRQIDRRIL
ncbi:AAA family ATPase [Natrarchaeobius chitinivorans]|uniref:Kinase n=1 Tax=Natrarchaeobius chitinivorans TaxID=1679083 RepID=A0A3N6P8T6_NATCH|nr:AAA family ATPase [Natrarchaeobius chitinivorans]RQG95139.1 kinase [Natrarchaeobius chitinivorans]